MEPLICPQCGGQVDETKATGDFVRCEYCNTEFHVESGARASDTSYAVMPDSSSGSSRGKIFGVGGTLLIVACIGAFLIYTINNVRQTTGNATNSAKSAVNDALSIANAMRSAANAMANAAHQSNTNSRSPSPNPTPKKEAVVNK